MTKEIIQTLIPALSVLVGSGLTFFIQSKLMKKQLTLNKEKIRFEKNQESLAELKSYQVIVIYALTTLKEYDESFSKKEIKQKAYNYLYTNTIIFLEDKLSEAYVLYSKQLDLEIEGLPALYTDIDKFLSTTIKKQYSNINKVYSKANDYDSLIANCNTLLEKIKKKAETI